MDFVQQIEINELKTRVETLEEVQTKLLDIVESLNNNMDCVLSILESRI